MSDLGSGNLSAALLHLVLPGDGPTVAVVGDAYRFLVTGRETDGRYAIWEAVVPPGGGPPLHMHTRESEAFFILSGELAFTVDGRHIRGTTGTFVHLAANTRHNFKNVSAAPARTLILVTPAGLEDYFLEIGTPLSSILDPPPRPTPDDIARLAAAAPRYGLTIFPPNQR